MPERVRAVAPLRWSAHGGSGSFLVRADDGRRYWCKTLNNLQAPMVPVNEQIVARIGWILGVAVCEPRLVEIPDGLVGWEFRQGYRLERGWAHGNLDVGDGAVVTGRLERRSNGGNAVRHAGFFALHDLLGGWGSSASWLYDPSGRYFSHDHGHYLWGLAWTAESLWGKREEPAELLMDAEGLDAVEVERLASTIEGLEGEEVAAALPAFPDDWPVDAAMVSAVVDLVLARGAGVAARLRALTT